MFDTRRAEFDPPTDITLRALQGKPMHSRSTSHVRMKLRGSAAPELFCMKKSGRSGHQTATSSKTDLDPKRSHFQILYYSICIVYDTHYILSKFVRTVIHLSKFAFGGSKGGVRALIFAECRYFSPSVGVAVFSRCIFSLVVGSL